MSSLLHTAMANASLQSGHPPSPAKSQKRLPSDKGRLRSSATSSRTSNASEDDDDDHQQFAGYSDLDSDDDEMVDLATRPTTPVISPQMRARDSEEQGRFSKTHDPVSLFDSYLSLSPRVERGEGSDNGTPTFATQHR